MDRLREKNMQFIINSTACSNTFKSVVMEALSSTPARKYICYSSSGKD